ncbi:oxidoreductase, aldo/keto reductase family protein [Ostertagia ostertagi]
MNTWSTSFLLQLWVTHLHPDDVESALRESLRKLQIEYVDLYLAHAPTCFNKDMKSQNHYVKVQDTWRGMEDVYKKGLAKAIGVSNYSPEQIERIMKTSTVPIHNCQAEVHLYWPQHELHQTCKLHNIVLTSFATLDRPVVEKSKRFQQDSEFCCHLMTEKVEWPEAPRDLDDVNVKALAQKYSKTPAQILLRYVLDRNIAVIPKSVNPARIAENFKVRSTSEYECRH